MAKKKKTIIEEETPQVENTVETNVETVVTEEPKVRERLKPSNEWEVKDRVYYLTSKKKPITRSIRSTNIYYFDEEKGYERELKYCQNQRTCFVDEMKGEQRLEHIVFRSGNLFVPKEKTTLQKFLSLYHPHRDSVYYEHKPVKIAEDQLDWLEFEVEALKIAKD